jgi:uncharacterized OB-fold protein
VPGLYSLDSGDFPSLLARRCADCGYVFFPPHAFGCEVCGALPERTEPTRLAAVGVLRSFATVHRHGGAGIEAPFVVGEIALDAGPMVRAVIAGEHELRIGDRMRALLWTTPASSASGDREEKVELRFEPVSPDGAG